MQVRPQHHLEKTKRLGGGQGEGGEVAARAPLGEQRNELHLARLGIHLEATALNTSQMRAMGWKTSEVK